MSLLEDANFDNIPDKDPEITKEELIQCLLNEYRRATAKGVNGYLCLRRVEEQIAMKKELGDEITESDMGGNQHGPDPGKIPRSRRRPRRHPELRMDTQRNHPGIQRTGYPGRPELA